MEAIPINIVKNGVEIWNQTNKQLKSKAINLLYLLGVVPDAYRRFCFILVRHRRVTPGNGFEIIAHSAG